MFRPPAIINRMPERWRETFFGNKSPRRRLLLWGVGVFLLGCYAGPISGWLLGYWSDPVRFLSFLMVAAGLMLMLLWLLAFIWREVRGWGR